MASIRSIHSNINFTYNSTADLIILSQIPFEKIKLLLNELESSLLNEKLSKYEAQQRKKLITLIKSDELSLCVLKREFNDQLYTHVINFMELINNSNHNNSNHNNSNSSSDVNNKEIKDENNVKHAIEVEKKNDDISKFKPINYTLFDIVYSLDSLLWDRGRIPSPDNNRNFINDKSIPVHVCHENSPPSFHNCKGCCTEQRNKSYKLFGVHNINFIKLLLEYHQIDFVKTLLEYINNTVMIYDILMREKRWDNIQLIILHKIYDSKYVIQNLCRIYPLPKLLKYLDILGLELRYQSLHQIYSAIKGNHFDTVIYLTSIINQSNDIDNIINMTSILMNPNSDHHVVNEVYKKIQLDINIVAEIHGNAHHLIDKLLSSNSIPIFEYFINCINCNFPRLNVIKQIPLCQNTDLFNYICDKFQIFNDGLKEYCSKRPVENISILDGELGNQQVNRERYTRNINKSDEVGNQQLNSERNALNTDDSSETFHYLLELCRQGNMEINKIIYTKLGKNIDDLYQPTMLPIYIKNVSPDKDKYENRKVISDIIDKHRNTILEVNNQYKMQLATNSVPKKVMRRGKIYSGEKHNITQKYKSPTLIHNIKNACVSSCNVELMMYIFETLQLDYDQEVMQCVISNLTHTDNMHDMINFLVNEKKLRFNVDNIRLALFQSYISFHFIELILDNFESYPIPKDIIERIMTKFHPNVFSKSSRLLYQQRLKMKYM